MRRESHVRFWEGGGVQFPSATRHLLALCHRPSRSRYTKHIQGQRNSWYSRAIVIMRFI